MDKKKILIVSSSFYPENSPRSNRTTELAKEFAKQGHKVTVLTPKKEEHIEFEKTHTLTIKDLGIPLFKGINIDRRNRYASLFFKALRRGLNLLLEYPQIGIMFLVTKKIKNESGYNLMISIAVPYPVHWGVATRWNNKQNIAKTWVADCGDPYMGCETDSFKKPFYFKYVEKWFMRKADHITIPVESARTAYYQEFHHKISIIPQGFKFELSNSINTKPKDDIPIFAYAGGFLPNIRDPRQFLNYLTTLNINFKFYIFTKSEEILNPYKDLLGEKLDIRSYIPRKKLLEVLSSMHFLVNFDNNTNTAIPSKLIDYAISGKPILNIRREFDKNAIDQFLSGDYRHAYQINNIDQYRIENVCSKFLSLTSSNTKR